MLLDTTKTETETKYVSEKSQPSTGLHVAKLTFQNILGIKHLEVKLGQFNEITGPNGSCKTSLLNGLKALLEGGHDATILHKGETEGSAVIVLDDGMELREDVTANGTKYSVREPVHGSKLGEPRKIISKLFDANQFNPVSFLAAKGKARLDMLPLEVSGEEIRKALGEYSIGSDVTGGIESLEEVRKNAFKARTDCNRALKEKEGTVSELGKAVPSAEDLAVDWAGAAKIAEEEDKNTREDRANQIAVVEAESKRKEAEADRHSAACKSTADTAAEKEIAAIRARVAAEKAEIDSSIELSKNNIRAERDNKKETLSAAYSDQLEKLSAASATAREKADAHIKAKTTLDILNRMKGEAKKLEEQSAKLTAALERLDKLKETLVSKVPIKGLDVRDGEIYLNDIHFDRVNTANQVDFSIELAKLGARNGKGKLKLIIVDGIERMDAKFRESFEARASLEKDTQFLVTRVTDDEKLGIRTVGEIAAIGAK